MSSEWTHASAQAVYDRLAPKPAPEPAAVANFRRARTRVTSDAAATAVFNDAVSRATPDEIDQLLRVNAELEADMARQAEEALAAEISDALGPQRAAEQTAATPVTDRFVPYVDDSGALRSSDGRRLDAEASARELRTLAETDQRAADDLLGRLDPGTFDAVQAVMLGDTAQE